CALAQEPLNKDELNRRYENAVTKAAHLTDHDRATELETIERANSDLTWREATPSSQVLVVTWTDGSYDTKTGRSFPTKDAIWVTVPREFRRHCSGLSESDRDMRVRQILGLPPSAEMTRVVLLWVRPDDLFRPCENPDISASRCSRSVMSHGRF